MLETSFPRVMEKKQTFWVKFKPEYFIWLGLLWGLISLGFTLLFIFEIFTLYDYLPDFLTPIIGLSFFVFFLSNDGFNGLAMTEASRSC
ncbi:hypothetical protein IPG41_04945 [Candidatus Peregrinibacteria bacterium]|nr:MAG: hypothetical protein IPG41_04945 [Candidatus Peregrinibacteria bacterium]